MTQIPAPPPQQKTSVWLKVVLGCFGVFVLGVIGIVVLFNIGTRRIVSSVQETMKNPKLREERAKRMLGASKLPEGYYPISATLEVPLVTHVELSDRAPDQNGGVEGFDKRAFIFTESIYTDSSKKLEAFFSGAPDSEFAVEDVGIRYRPKETAHTGTIALGPETIRYRAGEGRVEGRRSEAEGPMVLMWIDCAGNKKERYAAWFAPDASILEESSIRNFMSQFDLCRAK